MQKLESHGMGQIKLSVGRLERCELISARFGSRVKLVEWRFMGPP
jgi:hypothetical protein